MTEISFTLPGLATWRARPRHLTDDFRPRKGRPVMERDAYEAEIDDIIRAHLPERFPPRVPLALEVTQYFRTMRDGRHRRDQLEGRIMPTGKGVTAQTLLYNITDRISVLLYEDDLQLVDVTVHKRYGPQDEIKITLKQMEVSNGQSDNGANGGADPRRLAGAETA